MLHVILLLLQEANKYNKLKMLQFYKHSQFNFVRSFF